MDKKELTKVFALAKSLWSSFKIPENDLDLAMLSAVWLELLTPYDFNLIKVSMMQYANENDFCNISKVSALCKKYIEIKNGTYLDENIIIDHIRRAVSWTKSKENFEKLTDFEKEIVRGPHILARWSQDEAFESVIVSNLRKEIRSKLELKQQEELLKIDNQNYLLLGM